MSDRNELPVQKWPCHVRQTFLAVRFFFDFFQSVEPEHPFSSHHSIPSTNPRSTAPSQLTSVQRHTATMMRPATRSLRATCSSLRQASSERTYASASAASSSNSSSTSTETQSLPSAAPPGTVLKGVSIFKDKPDPVALQDQEYPPWLFKLLDDPSIASSSSLASIEMAGMSKGEARAAQKRQSKILRAAQLAKEKAEAKAAERAAKAGSTEVGKDVKEEQQATLSEAEQRAQAAAKAAEEEKARRKSLRRANKESIKARNFVSAS